MLAHRADSAVVGNKRNRREGKRRGWGLKGRAYKHRKADSTRQMVKGKQKVKTEMEEEEGERQHNRERTSSPLQQAPIFLSCRPQNTSASDLSSRMGGAIESQWGGNAKKE